MQVATVFTVAVSRVWFLVPRKGTGLRDWVGRHGETKMSALTQAPFRDEKRDGHFSPAAAVTPCVTRFWNRI